MIFNPFRNHHNGWGSDEWSSAAEAVIRCNMIASVAHSYLVERGPLTIDSEVLLTSSAALVRRK
jgi:hypothetical protein